MAGRHDYTANQDRARAWFDWIEASVTGFHWFENAACGPEFEEPTKAREVLLGDAPHRAISAADST